VSAGRVLVLGGTGEARQLAGLLLARGICVTSSLAGRVARPVLPPGRVRIGGFGGPHGLAAYLRAQDMTAVVDATHPFAARIGASAQVACRLAGVPLLRLDRPRWTRQPGDRWHEVDDLAAAAQVVPRLGRRILLALGGGGAGAFAGVHGAWFLVRAVQPPRPPLPARHAILLDRGPFTVERELALLDHHAIDLVVTRDSGGPGTSAKLDAARCRHLPVVVVRRPRRPATERAATVDGAARWALAQAAAARLDGPEPAPTDPVR